MHSAAWLLLVILTLNCLDALSQSFIKPLDLQLGYNKTTNLIFPYAIKSVDRGSGDILVLKSSGSENVLQVKAGKTGFDPTNLTVITADGKFYSFLVRYTENPLHLNLSFGVDSVDIFKLKAFLHITTQTELLKISLRGIYIYRHLLWFRFDISNGSLIDFKPAYTRFFITDKEKLQRVAEQEIGLSPKFQVSFPQIPGKSKKSIAFAFDPFTLPKDKNLILEMSEDQGGRLLRLPIGYRALLCAKGTGDQKSN